MWLLAAAISLKGIRVVLVIAVFGIMGVLTEAGMLDYLVEKIFTSKAGSIPFGAEILCIFGISICTIIFGGVTSASILTFGPKLNKVESTMNIRPYCRANLLDGTANSLPAIILSMDLYCSLYSCSLL